MINNTILQTELEYLSEFCEHETLNGYIRFWDHHLLDMYCHNFIWIEDISSKEKLLEIINFEIGQRKLEKATYLRLVIDGVVPISMIKTTLKSLQYQSKTELYDYFLIDSNKWRHISTIEDVNVVKAFDPQTKDHGRSVDIIANYKKMDVEFATRRIDRKFDVYNDPNKKTKLYVCYNKDEPIGNCELYLGDYASKIEDMDILDIYQRKGYGSQVLKALLRETESQNTPLVYLVTDHEDTAQDMYRKNGFILIGHRYEVMIRLD